MRNTCAVTGCRPTRFKFKYKEDYSLCRKIKKAMYEQFVWLHDECGVKRFYIGGTLGVDLWAGELLLRLKEQPEYGDIELLIAAPFPGHDSHWDQRSRKRLEFLKRHCTEYLVIGKNDCRESYLKRNRYMAEQADYLLAVCDDTEMTKGESLHMISCNLKEKRKIIYIHPDTAAVTLK